MVLWASHGQGRQSLKGTQQMLLSGPMEGRDPSRNSYSGKGNQGFVLILRCICQSINGVVDFLAKTRVELEQERVFFFFGLVFVRFVNGFSCISLGFFMLWS